MNFLFAAVIGYLIGSVPFAYVIGKAFYHTDVRQHGSGNLGGSNTGRGRDCGSSITSAFGNTLLPSCFVLY